MLGEVPLGRRTVFVDHLQKAVEIAVAVQREVERVRNEVLLSHEHHRGCLFGARAGNEIFIAVEASDNHKDHDQRDEQFASVAHDKVLGVADRRLDLNFGIEAFLCLLVCHNLLKIKFGN